MPYKFGKSSKRRLATLHPDLQVVLNIVIQYYNFSIICGHRNKANQNKAYKDNKSTKKWPDSRHNSLPSEAVDLAPWPIDWEDIQEFHFLAGLIIAVGEVYGIKIRWGGRFEDLKGDYGHFELVNK